MFSLCTQNGESQNVTQHIGTQVLQMIDIFLCLCISQLPICHITKININPHTYTQNNSLNKGVSTVVYLFLDKGAGWLLQCVVWDLLIYAVQISISKWSQTLC